jgi:hypothetical protein
MLQVGYEPTIPVFEQAKTVHALDRAATMTICLSMAVLSFVGPWSLFQFLNIYKVGRTPWTGDQPVARPLPTHRTIQTQNNINIVLGIVFVL